MAPTLGIGAWNQGDDTMTWYVECWDGDELLATYGGYNSKEGAEEKKVELWTTNSPRNTREWRVVGWDRPRYY